MHVTASPARASRSVLAMASLSAALLASLPANAQTYPTVVVFEEVSSTLDPIYTRPVAPMAGGWGVAKFIFNAGRHRWTDYHIKLQVLVNGEWVDSGEADGISFDQPRPFDDWLKSVKVDIDGVFVDGWHVVRTNLPFDSLDFFFDNFTIPQGATLSLHFDMFDTQGDNIWRLKQIPTIPEPANWALFALGLCVLAMRGRQRRRQA
jgi:hypothetical protein